MTGSISNKPGERSIEIIVGASLELSGLPVKLEEAFKRENTFRNPQYDTLKRLNKYAGDTPQLVKLWRQSKDGGLILPRGHFSTVIAKLQEQGLTYHVGDVTLCPELGQELKLSGNLYPYQENALTSLLRFPTGVLEGVTGSGKTNILLSTVPRLETTTLILTHTKELLSQTADRARSWLGIDPGIIGAGKFKLRPVTVAMIQTLARRDLQQEGIANYFGSVLVDECHHSPALTWARILEQLPARYKYRFTATAWHKDRLGFLLWRLIGNRNAKIERKEVEQAGKIVWPKVQVVQTEFECEFDEPSQWGEMLSLMVRDGRRNRLITREVRNRLTEHSRALILTDRIEHANILAGMLSYLSPVVLTVDLLKSERSAGMAKIRAGARLTIATISLLSEGVDCPLWDLLFLVSPMAGGPRVLQALGRITRSAPGKERALLVEFVDSRVSMLQAAWRKRERLYRAA